MFLAVLRLCTPVYAFLYRSLGKGSLTQLILEFLTPAVSTAEPASGQPEYPAVLVTFSKREKPTKNH